MPEEHGQRLQALLDGLAGGFEHGVGLAIEHFPAPQNTAKIAHGLTTLRDGSAIALLEDARHVHFGFRPKPDGAWPRRYRQ